MLCHCVYGCSPDCAFKPRRWYPVQEDVGTQCKRTCLAALGMPCGPRSTRAPSCTPRAGRRRVRAAQALLPGPVHCVARLAARVTGSALDPHAPGQVRGRGGVGVGKRAHALVDAAQQALQGNGPAPVALGSLAQPPMSQERQPGGLDLPALGTRAAVHAAPVGRAAQGGVQTGGQRGPAGCMPLAERGLLGICVCPQRAGMPAAVT